MFKLKNRYIIIIINIKNTVRAYAEVATRDSTGMRRWYNSAITVTPHMHHGVMLHHDAKKVIIGGSTNATYQDTGMLW